MDQKTIVGMSVRILDKNGAEIAAFDGDESVKARSGFSAELRSALLVFRGEYPDARFIDVEFEDLR